MADELFTMSVCPNCLMVGFNADDSGVDPSDPTPLGLVEPGLWFVGLDDPDGEAHFSHSTCEGCGALPGDRLDVLVEVR